MDASWGHCAKWNKADTKRQILVWFHFYEGLRTGEFIEKESRMQATRGWAGMNSLFNEHRVSVLHDEESSVSGGGWWWCNSANVLNATELTLRNGSNSKFHVLRIFKKYPQWNQQNAGGTLSWIGQSWVPLRTPSALLCLWPPDSWSPRSSSPWLSLWCPLFSFYPRT